MSSNLACCPAVAKRTGLSVAASVNLPPNAPLVQAFVERRLVQELEQLKLVHKAEGLS